MAITVPSTFPQVPDFTLGRQIRSAEWRGLLQANNYLFTRCGSLVDSIVYDPFWSTESTSFVLGTTTPTLERFEPLWVPTRGSGSAGDEYSLWITFYGLAVQIELTPRNVSSGTSLSTILVEQPSSTPEWVAQELIVRSDQDPFTFSLRARRSTENAVAARIYHLAYYETRELASSSIPRRA